MYNVYICYRPSKYGGHHELQNNNDKIRIETVSVFMLKSELGSEQRNNVDIMI